MPQEHLTTDEVKRAARKLRSESLESRFERAWEQYADPSLPKPERQYQFAPPRRWKWDFAWPIVKLAVDIQGGAFGYGHHARGKDQMDDHEKQNTAVLMGWRVLQFGTKAMDDPEAVIDTVVAVLTNAKEVA